MFSLEGKIAFITGGASGIGRAVAERFIKAGARVAIADIGDGSAVAEEIGAIFVQADVSDENSLARCLVDVEAEVGKIDILVNNAGVGDIGFDFAETPAELVEKVVSINQNGVLWGLKHGPRHMNDGGSVINTSSLASSLSMLGTGVYSATKAAVEAMTRMAALELADRNIRVNAVAPSYVATSLGNDEEGEALVEAFVPLRRVATPDEIAGIFHFLAAEESCFISGQSIIADGGWSAGPSRNLLKLAAGDDKTHG